MNSKPRAGYDTDMHRERRGRNFALLGALVAFVVLVFFVAIVRIGG